VRCPWIAACLHPQHDGKRAARDDHGSKPAGLHDDYHAADDTAAPDHHDHDDPANDPG